MWTSEQTIIWKLEKTTRKKRMCVVKGKLAKWCNQIGWFISVNFKVSLTQCNFKSITALFIIWYIFFSLRNVTIHSRSRCVRRKWFQNHTDTMGFNTEWLTSTNRKWNFKKHIIFFEKSNRTTELYQFALFAFSTTN